jgi:hypothetical protein
LGCAWGGLDLGVDAVCLVLSCPVRLKLGQRRAFDAADAHAPNALVPTPVFRHLALPSWGKHARLVITGTVVLACLSLRPS